MPGARFVVTDSASPQTPGMVTPEYSLLLDATRGGPSQDAGRGSWSSRQWDRALELAAWHRLAPLLYRHLLGPAECPPDVLAVLERAYLANAARNLRIRASLDQISATLAGQAIPALPLKGAALIGSVYPDPAVREMVDVDILVPADRLAPAHEAIAALGFRRATAPRSEREMAAWMRVHHMHDPPLVSPDGIVAVELHHHVAIDDERTHFDVAGIWQRARVAHPGWDVFPSPEDLLLHACVHFTRNRHGRSDGALGEICDIASIVGSEPIDWDLLTRIVRGYRLGSRVFLSLFAARELGLPIPDQPLRGLRPPGFEPRLGRRMVELRVLRTGTRVPVRRLGWIVAPPRSTLTRAWGAPSDGRRLRLAGAYLRRARAQLPFARLVLTEPRVVFSDYLLNGRIDALERAERAEAAAGSGGERAAEAAGAESAEAGR
jgi:Uncharacterised nucleotidyltransferase